MFRRLLPRAAAASLAVPAVAQPPVLELPEGRKRSRRADLALKPNGVVACEVAAAVARTPSVQAKVLGGPDAFHRQYELGDELGRGNFGVVQRARHKATGQLRAVKRVQVGAVSAALEEAQILASLDHPNVVGFHECFTVEDEVVLVEELCEGDPLNAKLGSVLGFGLEPREAAVALQQMLVAVKHCHERGVVHRDLKADNFVFSSASPSAPLKLIDFGLAGRCSSGERLPGRAGTVDYSSPEALWHGFGQPADVWSLGALFFLLITGEPLIKVDPPAPAQTPSEELQRALEGQVMRKVLSAKYVKTRVSTVAPRLPVEAVSLLEAMLQPDPCSRITAEQALQHPFILGNASKQLQANVE